MRDELFERLNAVAGLLRAGSRNFVYRGAAAFSVIVVLLVAGVLWGYWTALYKDAQSRSTTLAFLLAEQTTRTFQAVDLTLSGLAPFLEAGQHLPEHDPAFEKLLVRRVAELDSVHALYVVDTSGRVTQTSGAVREIVADVSAHPYLADFQRDPTVTFLIGQPLFSRPGHLSAIPVMRRLTANGDGFAGMLVASVEPRYFSDFYRNLDLGRRGSIDLYQDNGSILLASTGGSAAADAAPALALTPTFDVDSILGNFRSPGVESDERLVAFHRASPYPLVVAVGIDLADLRWRWWRIAAPSMVAAAAIVAMAAALAALVMRRLHERRRARSRAVMVQKLEALGQMTASVSHDFRNLLAVMSSTLRLIRRRGPDETVLRAAEEALERGDKLIGQLLAFSKRHELQVRPVSINALLDGLDHVLRHAAGGDVALVYRKAEGLPACRADQTQFDAALMNLVVNARHAMPKGGEVTITTRAAGADNVELSVSDTGTGIAPGDLRRIFEPFFTTKVDTGTGLGLAQVYDFMRGIGGDVRVASQIGVGTTFTMLFPVAEVAPRDAVT